MRIIDWSSDVCSSDLRAAHAIVQRRPDKALADRMGPGRTARDPTSIFHGFFGKLLILDHAIDDVPAFELLGRIAIAAKNDLTGPIGAAKGGKAFDAAQEGGSADMHRSEEHTSELQSLMRNSYAVF